MSRYSLSALMFMAACKLDQNTHVNPPPYQTETRDETYQDQEYLAQSYREMQSKLREAQEQLAALRRGQPQPCSESSLAYRAIQAVVSGCMKFNRCYEINDSTLDQLLNSDEFVRANSVTAANFEDLLVNVPHTAVFFPTAQHDFTLARGLRNIDEIGNMVKASKRILVIGRASRAGGQKANRVLAGRRAFGIREHLAVRFNLPYESFDILVFGEETAYLEKYGNVVASAVGVSPAQYRDDRELLNQSAWIFVYGCITP